MSDDGPSIRLFSTLPPSSAVDPDHYLQAALRVARWSEEAGCVGTLVYTDNSLLDPWAVAQALIAGTRSLAPLVAVQPVYMHPYAVAKAVTSLGRLYGRQVHLNMVAGGFVNDLRALSDETDHDARYERLVEYTMIVMDLLRGDGPVTFAGRWYSVKNLRLTPALSPELLPSVTVSGSSVAGLSAARRLAATAIQYPRPAGAYEGAHELTIADKGIRLGVIARAEAQEAWRTAWARFPADRRGQLTHRLAMRTSDSVWHRQLSQLADESAAGGHTYWLHPFEHYKTFCPYLVGAYDDVAAALVGYLELGFSTFVMDVPYAPEDLAHVRLAFDRAQQLAVA